MSITKDDVEKIIDRLREAMDELYGVQSDVTGIALPDDFDIGDVDIAIDRARDEVSGLIDALEEYEVGPAGVDSYIDSAVVKVRWSREEQRPIHMTLQIGNPSPDRIEDDDGDELDQDNTQCGHWHRFLTRIHGTRYLYDEFGHHIIDLTIE